MKKVNASWEMRNLGLRVCELTFGADDNICEVNELIKGDEFDYYVARVPSGNISLVHDLESSGFRYLENQVSIWFTTDELPKINLEWRARFASYSCSRVESDHEFDEIVRRTREGLFEKDRFSVDPLISRDLPDRRIAYWIGDMRKDLRYSIYLIRNGDDIRGFFILKKRGPALSYVEMAAIFREYRGKGLPFMLIYNILAMASREGSKGITASLSVNNTDTLNTFTRFINFRIQGVNIILRKFNRGSL